MDRIKKIKIKQQDGTLSDYYPIGADAQNIDMPNGYDLNSVIGNIDVDNDGSIEFQLDRIKSNPIKLPNFFLGLFFRDSGSPIVDWYVSLNGVEWSQIIAPCSIVQRDISMQYNKKDNHFYRVDCRSATSFTLSKSKDLVNWTHKVINFSVPGDTTWAPDLYIDNDGILYVIVSNKYGTETVISGDTHPAFDNYLMRCTDINTLEFEPAYKLEVYNEQGTLSPNRNHIDGSLIKIDDIFYLTIKNEYSKINEIFSSTDLHTWTLVNSNITDSTLWVEGPQCVVTENNIYYYADLFSDSSYIMAKVPKNDFPNFNAARTKFNLMESLVNHSHGTVLYIDNDYAKSVISNLPGFTFNNIIETDRKYIKHITYTVGNNSYLYTTGKLPVFPNSMINIQGGSDVHEIHFRNLFGVENAKLSFAASDGSKIIIKGVDNTTFNTPYSITNSRIINEKEFDFPLTGHWASEPLSWSLHQENIISAPGDLDLAEDISGTIKIHQIGHIFTAIFNFRYTGTLVDGQTKNWYTLVTLPSKITPNENIMIINDKNVNGQIFQDGKIQFEKLDNQSIYGTAMWAKI